MWHVARRSPLWSAWTLEDLTQFVTFVRLQGRAPVSGAIHSK